ncbi:PRKR-interacting protein 1 homolog isoform X1 [Babylonia areolata]|uniref:PRKR-interacting protein 1 homolog isoform X1 n=2 Tax=Babylonia areolata TaxID=304850 RepID=UPI003FD4A159
MASKTEKQDGEAVSVAKTPAELQRMRLEKLMKNPAKPVYIPDPSKAAKMKEPPEFIRNVWGSSAGAGSGDFHVYRGVRRREYARQKFTNEITQKLTAEQEYHRKVEENKKAAEERTAKKRAKRQKKKEKMKNKKMKKEEVKTDESSGSEEEAEKEKKKEKERAAEDEDKSNSDERSNTDTDTKDES